MKKLLYILLFVPLALFGQENDPCYSINNVYQEIEEANLPITLDLLSGWNMIGYSCVNESDAQDLLAPISDKIIMAKNNAGSVYMPEFGFNGIGNLLPNQGYMFKMSETLLGFELCNYHINYHQIEGCTDCAAMNFYLLANVDDGSCQYNICSNPQADNYQEVLPCIYYGCNNPLAANYDPYANIDDGSCVVAEACPYEIFLEYSPDAISYNENLCLNIIVEGCTDNTALNYNTQANLDDESCEFIYGCTEYNADNFNEEATTNDGFCIYYGCIDPTAGNYDESANTDDGSCLVGGCMNPTAENYNADAVIDDGTCIIYGCTLSSFPNYNSVANIGDGSCDMNSLDVFGCIDSTYYGYYFQGFEANQNNGTCGELVFNGDYQIGSITHGGIVFYVDSSGQRGLVASLEDVQLGSYDGVWGNYNGFEWGCYGNEIEGAKNDFIGGGYQNTLDVINNQCNVEFGSNYYNASEACVSYSFMNYSDWFLPSKDELHMLYQSLEPIDYVDFNYHYWSSTQISPNHAWIIGAGGGSGSGSMNPYYHKMETLAIKAIRAFGSWTMGCMDTLACNFNPEANMADGSCEYPEQGYDCDGNVNFEVGDEAFGGIVFYVDETGQHGLVAATEDIGQYEWGCSGQGVNGADGTSIGTGYQNSIDIVNQGCSTENGGITAAQAALDAEINGYSDWFLPSIDELQEMYYSIGNIGPYGDIGEFGNGDYWSSTKQDPLWGALPTYFSNGFIDSANSRDTPLNVRPIRSY